MYLTKHSRRDIKNATWDLFKVINGTVFPRIHWVIKYVLGTRNLDLKIMPHKNEKRLWDFICLAIAIMQETQLQEES